MAFLSALGEAAPGAAPTASGTPGLQLSQYAPTLSTALGNYNRSNYDQNQLTKQLDNTINGTGGRSLAEQQLLNTTQQNAQGEAASIASQRGINPGLQARQIQNNTANLNQQEVGQAAQLRLQQQILAEQQKAALLAQQQNSANSLYGIGAGAQNQQNSGQVQQQQLNQDAYKSDLNASTSLIGSVASAAGTAATGGLSAVPAAAQLGKHAHGGEITGKDDASFKRAFLDAYCRAHGGPVPDPERAQELLMAWHAGKQHAEDHSDGGEVGGPAAEVPGDDERNDKTPILASKGERVIPRSIARDPAAVKAYIEKLNREKRGSDVMNEAPTHLLAARRKEAR